MLVFAGIVPHPPFLLPTVGKENTAKLKATADAIIALEKELYVTNPETIMVIAPHGQILPDAFTVHLSATYALSFKDLGDFQTTRQFRSDFMLIDHIQRDARKETPLSLASEESLDYGFGIPLLALTEHLPKAAIVPISVSGLDLKAHYDFGKVLKEDVMASNKRIAVIASADLAHTLTKEAPGGYAKEGADFDKAIQELLGTKNAAGMITLDPSLIAASATCGIRPIVTLLGALDAIQFQPKILSYEAPFGVGHMVATMGLA